MTISAIPPLLRTSIPIATSSLVTGAPDQAAQPAERDRPSVCLVPTLARRPVRRLYGGSMASVKQVQVTFDCANPERVARFWCEVLGYVVPPPPQGFATWDDFDRAQPPERQGSAFACIDP